MPANVKPSAPPTKRAADVSGRATPSGATTRKRRRPGRPPPFLSNVLARAGFAAGIPAAMPKLLHVIVACAENRTIGRDGKLPWRIPEDVAHFRELTAGNVCVLGRICFDTWPEATHAGRRPIVLTSHPLPPRRRVGSPEAEPAPRTAHSLAEALAAAERLPGEIFVCGGQKIFEETLALPRALRLHLTLVHADVSGDRFFPEWRGREWRELDRRESGDANYRYTFLTLDRVE